MSDEKVKHVVAEILNSNATVSLTLDAARLLAEKGYLFKTFVLFVSAIGLALRLGLLAITNNLHTYLKGKRVRINQRNVDDLSVRSILTLRRELINENRLSAIDKELLTNYSN